MKARCGPTGLIKQPPQHKPMQTTARISHYPNNGSHAMATKRLSMAQGALYGVGGYTAYLALRSLDDGNFLPAVVGAAAVAVISAVEFMRRKAAA
jgi:hypothetical protein